MSPADEPGIDPRLRAALDHAPDADLHPPPALRQAVLRAAHAAQAAPAAPRWRRAWQALWAPRGLAAVAGIASIGIALKLAWRPEPEWLADTVEPRPAGVAQAPERSEPALPPIAQAPAPAPAHPAEVATAPPAPAPPPAAREAAKSSRRPAAPPASLPAPSITTAPVVTPEQPAPAAAPAAPPSPRVPAEALPGTAAAPAGAEQRAAQARAVDAQALARARRSEALELAKAVPSALLPGHPPALARWATALAQSDDDAAGPPPGWQVRLGGAATAWGPAQRAWWQALVSGTAGRWSPDTGEPPAGGGLAWQAQGPDGTGFSLRLDGAALRLQSGAGAWRAARPPGLADAP